MTWIRGSAQRQDDFSATQAAGWLTLFLLLAAGAIVLWWKNTPPGIVDTDVAYYWAHVRDVKESGFAEVLPEYPLPAALLLWLPSLLVTTYPAYYNLFWITSVILCLVLVALLFSAAPTRKAGVYAAALWLACLGAAGPLSLFRYDLWPALFAATAILAYSRQQMGGWSAWLSFAAAIKLWPAMLWPLGLAGLGTGRNGRHSKRLRQLVVSLLASIAFWVALSLAVGGGARLLAPFTWQQERGLHVESLLSVWVVWARLLVGDAAWPAALSDSNSVDFTGPGVAATLVLGTALGALAAGFMAVIIVRLWRTPNASVATVSLSASLTVWLLLTVNKVFSPQYLMWVLPLFAAAAAFQRFPRRWIVAALLISFITGLAYPAIYWQLFAAHVGLLEKTGAALLLTVRAAAMVGLSLSIGRHVWKATAR